MLNSSADDRERNVNLFRTQFRTIRISMLNITFASGATSVGWVYRTTSSCMIQKQFTGISIRAIRSDFNVIPWCLSLLFIPGSRLIRSVLTEEQMSRSQEIPTIAVDKDRTKKEEKQQENTDKRGNVVVIWLWIKPRYKMEGSACLKSVAPCSATARL